ncbi:MAG: type II secretion system F family protein [Sulfurimonas sp.]|nr:type II secretion system F family protein [Sulfurimonas sp.]
MKNNLYTMLKTLLFTMQNGKSISSGMQLLAKTSQNAKEKKIYTNIYNDLRDGNSFSASLKKHKLGSLDITQFIMMAEKSVSFKVALEKIIEYMEVKDRFQRESNEKTTLPFIYLVLATIGVLAVKFFAVPYQMHKASEYSQEIVELTANHLYLAQLMTNVLFVMLVLVATYFSTLMLALFSHSSLTQNLAKEIGLALPFISKIIKRFEKFMLFSLLGEMIQSNISFKDSMHSAIETTTIKSYKTSIKTMLNGIKYNGKLKFSGSIYDDLEKELLLGVGSSYQVGTVMLEISSRARTDALRLTTSFFRLITVMSILLMAFTVFIEFYTVVLTQIIIQKGLIDMVKGAGVLQ